MCMYTRSNIPRVATRDIHCIKYLQKHTYGYETPCRNTPVKLGETLKPSSSIVDIKEYCKDDFGNQVYEVNGGVIHAKLIPGGFSCQGFDAIIPEGTMYLVDPFGIEICAKKLKITKKQITSVTDTSFAEEILSTALEVNGVRVADYVTTTGEFVHPSAELSKETIIGRVVGFHNNEPLIAVLDYEIKDWDPQYDSRVNEYITNREDALKDFSGKESTDKYKKSRYKRLNAYEYCINYNPNVGEYYFPALGEITTMLNNAIYLNAAVAISGIGFVIDTSGGYWSCSEGSCGDAWCCDVGYDRVRSYWYGKRCSYRVVPFLAKLKTVN